MLQFTFSQGFGGFDNEIGQGKPKATKNKERNGNNTADSMRFAKDMPWKALTSPETLETIMRNRYFALSDRH
jgi:hypothetical protein